MMLSLITYLAVLIFFAVSPAAFGMPENITAGNLLEMALIGAIEVGY